MNHVKLTWGRPGASRDGGGLLRERQAATLAACLAQVYSGEAKPDRNFLVGAENPLARWEWGGFFVQTEWVEEAPRGCLHESGRWGV